MLNSGKRRGEARLIPSRELSNSEMNKLATPFPKNMFVFFAKDPPGLVMVVHGKALIFRPLNSIFNGGPQMFSLEVQRVTSSACMAALTGEV